jgi:hypothetical protein
MYVCQESLMNHHNFFAPFKFAVCAFESIKSYLCVVSFPYAHSFWLNSKVDLFLILASLGDLLQIISFLLKSQIFNWLSRFLW